MNNGKFRKILNCISYFVIMFIAVALILAEIFGKGDGTSVLNQIGRILRTIAEALAYTVTACYAFYFTRTKRSVWWLIVFSVAVLLVIIFFILPLF